MRRTIFYSWQSDLPNATNRGFIQQALENVANSITTDDTVDVEPVIDRDTQGVAGSPDISLTIFEKIAKADVVIADVSIIGRIRKTRSTPNPNVLIELGYALRALGSERIILVFNRAFGRVEELPFDLRMRRVLSYSMAEVASERAPERIQLEKLLDPALRAALDSVPRGVQVDGSSPSITAIENLAPNRVVLLRPSLAVLLAQIDTLQPIKPSNDGTIENLREAIDRTEDVVTAFSKISETISVMNDSDTALELYRWFGQLFERYDRPPNFTGTFTNADFDYFRFVGHEMFVTFIAFLLKEQRWSLLIRVLDEPIPVSYTRIESGPGTLDWTYACQHLVLLLDASRQAGRISLHADILSQRHEQGTLSVVLPLEEFIAADYLLFLRGEFTPAKPPSSFMDWHPWSVLYVRRIPFFVRSAERVQIAEQLCKVLNTPTIAELRKRFTDRAPRVRQLFRDGSPRASIRKEDIERIGTFLRFFNPPRDRTPTGRCINN